MKKIKNALAWEHWTVRFLLPGILALLFFASHPAHAHYIQASSDMSIGNLRFSFVDPNAQWQWTDLWYGEVRAHAADSNSSPADDSNSLLGNDGSIQAVANTAHVHSQADYTAANGDQVGSSPSAGTGFYRCSLEFLHPV